MNKKIIAIMMTLILVSSLAIGCQGASDSGDQPGTERSYPVEVSQVILGAMDSALVVTGELTAQSEVDLIPKAAGRVEEILVKKGDYVEKGQVIARLEAKDYENNLAQARVGLESALVNYDSVKFGQDFNLIQSEQNLENAKLGLRNAELAEGNAKQALADTELNLERMQALYAADAIAKKDLEQVETGYLQAQAGYEQAQIGIIQAQAAIATAEKALEQAKRPDNIKMTQVQVDQARIQVKLAEDQLANTVITAPIAGELTSLNAQVGAMASQQMAFGKIIQKDPMIVKSKLSEEGLKSFRTGDKVIVNVKAVDVAATGIVSFISSITDAQTKSYAMEIELTATSDILRPGMIAEISAAVDSDSQVTLVPSKALILDGQSYYVYIISGDRAERRQVEIGRDSNEYIEVISGLAVGDRVISKGHLTIQDGAKIQILGGE